MYDIWDAWGWLVKTMAGVALVILGINACTNSETWKRAGEADRAQAAADAQPRVIREVDGCKVYAFKAGDYWHYFTRCPMDTTTESNWAVPVHHGKTTTYERRSDTMVTPNTPALK